MIFGWASFRNQTDWDALSLTSCVSLGKSISLSQVSSLLYKVTMFAVCLWGLTDAHKVKCWLNGSSTSLPQSKTLSKTGYCTIQKMITLKFCLEQSFFSFLGELKIRNPIICLQIALFVLYTMLIPSDHNLLGLFNDLHSCLVSLATLPLSSSVTCPLLTPKVRHSFGSVLTFFLQSYPLSKYLYFN